MSMVITTRNSVYELDTEQMRVRRTQGANPPVGKFEEVGDGNWFSIDRYELVAGNEGTKHYVFWYGFDYVVTSNVLSVSEEVTA